MERPHTHTHTCMQQPVLIGISHSAGAFERSGASREVAEEEGSGGPVGGEVLRSKRQISDEDGSWGGW